MEEKTKFKIEPTEVYREKLPSEFLKAKKEGDYVKISPRIELDGTLIVSAMVFEKKPKLSEEEKNRRKRARDEIREKKEKQKQNEKIAKARKREADKLKREATKKVEKEKKIKGKIALYEAKLRTL